MNNFLTNNDKYIETDGTSKRGTIHVSYDDLISIFGEPLTDGIPEGSRVEWSIEFDDGVIATIYDKNETIPVEDVTDWIVGGKSHKSMLNVLMSLENKHINAQESITYKDSLTESANYWF